jgi:site-specific DNA-adenine methylase
MAGMRYQSPLRYPGAKSGLTPVIARLVEANMATLGRPELFVEPFAGGASTSLRLAGNGTVRCALISDADPLVARFWQVAAAETDWLVDRMWDEPVTLERWDHWRTYEPSGRDDRESAVKCLFLNRTTFSGILHGRARPIGGRAQRSEHKIGCRFAKQSLERRLRYVGDLYRTERLLDVWCKDWSATIADIGELYPPVARDNVLVYLDPPYLAKSARLYLRSFDLAAPSTTSVSPAAHGWRDGPEHYRLADYLRTKMPYRWVLSYDHHPLLTDDIRLYAGGRMTPDDEDKALLGVREWRLSKRLVRLRYSASSGHGRGDRAELLVTTLPPNRVPTDETLQPL